MTWLLESASAATDMPLLLGKKQVSVPWVIDIVLSFAITTDNRLHQIGDLRTEQFACDWLNCIQALQWRPTCFTTTSTRVGKTIRLPYIFTRLGFRKPVRKLDCCYICLSPISIYPWSIIMYECILFPCILYNNRLCLSIRLVFTNWLLIGHE